MGKIPTHVITWHVHAVRWKSLSVHVKNRQQKVLCKPVPSVRDACSKPSTHLRARTEFCLTEVALGLHPRRVGIHPTRLKIQKFHPVSNLLTYVLASSTWRVKTLHHPFPTFAPLKACVLSSLVYDLSHVPTLSIISNSYNTFTVLFHTLSTYPKHLSCCRNNFHHILSSLSLSSVVLKGSFWDLALSLLYFPTTISVRLYVFPLFLVTTCFSP